MRKEVVWNWKTIIFGAADQEIVQSQDQWIDTSGYRSGCLMFQCCGVPPEDPTPDVTFRIETAPEPGAASWTELPFAEEIPATPPHAVSIPLTTAADQPAYNRFDRWIRWRAVSANGTAQLCFRAVWVFKA
jgi:hypothetical protein